MGKVQKTNAMRALDKGKISYNVYTYECKDGRIDGLAVAEKLNEDPDTVFKTLVVQGHSREFYVFFLPVNKELNLKKAAKVAGEKVLKSNPNNFNLDLEDLVKIISLLAKSLNH